MNHLDAMDCFGLCIAFTMSGCAIYALFGPVHSFAQRKKKPAQPEAIIATQPQV